MNPGKQRLRLLLITISLLLFLRNTLRTETVLDPLFTAKIDSILRDQKEALHLPGVAFAIVENDRVVYIKAFGLRDVDANLPMTPDTVVPIGSCTKAFTSFTVGIAQEQGKLSLEDHPRKFLPWFKMADPEANEAVILQDMLSHRTGLKANADLAAEPGILTREEYVRAATSAKPAVKFRGGFQYSNAMFSAVGLILGRVYGTSWERVVNEQIFKTLEMKSSFTSLTEAFKAGNHATGYVYDQGIASWRKVPPPKSLEALAPGGSIASSANDMAKWLRVLTGKGRFGEKRIISENTFNQITTGINPINDALTYALGWATYNWNGHQVVEHNGGSSGISALVSFIPDRGVGFVFLSNTSPNFMTTIGNAGNLMWPLILGEEAPPPKAKKKSSTAEGNDQTQTSEKLPDVQDFLKRMREASGSEKDLDRHSSLQIEAIKSYENHGVTADLLVRAAVPAKRVEEEKWYAAGRTIATLRVYFDGIHGGQETSFGQDAINDASANEQALRESTFHYLLHLEELYDHLSITGKSKVDDVDCYVLELKEKGNAVRLYVSIQNAFVLKRESEGQSMIYRDYRELDGEKLPYETVIEDALGETIIKIKSARFNLNIPDRAFAPHR
jgi:CubicO group peptidase (beta-lactamase class C family)